jgi:hypothetical protein
MGRVVRFSRGIVRAADDTRAACSLPAVHRPQHATDNAVPRSVAGVRQAFGEVIHPGLHRSLSGLLP